jgi:hypothetical protein
MCDSVPELENSGTLNAVLDSNKPTLNCGFTVNITVNKPDSYLL